MLLLLQEKCRPLRIVWHDVHVLSNQSLNSFLQRLHLVPLFMPNLFLD